MSSETRHDFAPLSVRQFLKYVMECGKKPTLESLADHIGASAHTVYQWNSGKRIPSDDLMLTMAAMTEIDQFEALLLLNVWRTKNRPRILYMKYLKAHGYHYIYPPTQELWFTKDDTEMLDDIRNAIRDVVRIEREQISAK